jgi:hypothetical protein
MMEARGDFRVTAILDHLFRSERLYTARYYAFVNLSSTMESLPLHALYL